MKAAAFELERVDAERRASEALYGEFLRVPSLSAGLYVLAAGSEDPQGPHAEDEIYHVLSGTAVLEVEGERHEAKPGTVLYVAAGAEHRFVDIEEELSLLVLFAPPES